MVGYYGFHTHDVILFCSDVIEMASYAPLFVNTNDRRWNPDAIVFNSWQSYGTPSYWVQVG